MSSESGQDRSGRGRGGDHGDEQSSKKVHGYQ